MMLSITIPPAVNRCRYHLTETHPQATTTCGSSREFRESQIFLSAYEDNSWANCSLDWLDKRKDGEPECLATRSDEKTLVIEHTLIQPFLKDKEDFARSKRFQCIEADKSLIIPGRIIYVNVPVGALQKGSRWEAVVNIVHAWLNTNIASFPEGR